jgi:hypothetical protein
MLNAFSLPSGGCKRDTKAFNCGRGRRKTSALDAEGIFMLMLF